METIFVADGEPVLSDGSALGRIFDREGKLAAIKAYLYSGWEFSSWGTAPADSNLRGITGFYFVRRFDHSGPGFGAGPQCARLRSGLHAAMELI